MGSWHLQQKDQLTEPSCWAQGHTFGLMSYFPRIAGKDQPAHAASDDHFIVATESMKMSWPWPSLHFGDEEEYTRNRKGQFTKKTPS